MPIDDILVAIIGAAADIFLGVCFYTLSSPGGQGSGGGRKVLQIVNLGILDFFHCPG